MTAALLTLTLTPKTTLVSNDVFGILPLGPVVTPAIQGLPLNVTSTVNLDLLSFYTSDAILARLSAGSGVLSALYTDDAIVSFARLELVSSVAAVPEPSYVLVVGGTLGIAMLVLRRRRSA